MTTTARAMHGVIDRSARSDAWLSTSIVASAALGFAVLVVLPHAVAGFAPPAGTDVLWGVGGPLVLVLAPLAAALAGTASGWALWSRGGLDDTTRRLHLTAIVTAAAFAAFLVSGRGQALLAWWQD